MIPIPHQHQVGAATSPAGRVASNASQLASNASFSFSFGRADLLPRSCRKRRFVPLAGVTRVRVSSLIGAPRIPLSFDPLDHRPCKFADRSETSSPRSHSENLRYGHDPSDRKIGNVRKCVGEIRNV